jgi:hypothetical protein
VLSFTAQSAIRVNVEAVNVDLEPIRKLHHGQVGRFHGQRPAIGEPRHEKFIVAGQHVGRAVPSEIMPGALD